MNERAAIKQDGLTIAKALRRAAEHIDQGWCRGGYARDAHGAGVFSNSPTAVRWCAYGALDLARIELGNLPAEHIENALAHVVGVHSLALWNDDRNQTGENVAATMRVAAERAEQEFYAADSEATASLPPTGSVGMGCVGAWGGES